MSLPKRYLIIFALLSLFLISLLTLHQTKSNPLPWNLADLVPAQTPVTMAPPVTHIVLLQFKDGISPTEIKKTTASFLALKHECKHPVTHTNYITSISGGLDNSKEGLQSSLTHAFILTFPTLMDRDFYVAKDPAHSLFKSSLKDLVEKVVVVDYVDGVFVPMEEGKEEKKD